MTLITLRNGDEYFVSESLDYVVAIPLGNRLDALLCLTESADGRPLTMRAVDVYSASGFHESA